MDKNIQCLYLMNNQAVIAEVIEVMSEIGDPDCKLVNPYLINQSSLELTKWFDFTNQSDIMVRSSDVLTFVEPTPELLAEYLTLID